MRGNRVIRGRAQAALLGLTVLVTAGLAACDPSGGSAGAPAGSASSSPAATPSSTAPQEQDDTATADEPCALVTKEEAEELADASLDDGKPLFETCTYTAPPDGPTAQVEVFVGDTGKSYFNAERALGHDLQPLPGIGDEAFIEDHNVFVKKSGIWVSIRLVRTEEPAKFRKPLEDLARKVADRI